MDRARRRDVNGDGITDLAVPAADDDGDDDGAGNARRSAPCTCSS